jgi:hypothetical protein
MVTRKVQSESEGDKMDVSGLSQLLEWKIQKTAVWSVNVKYTT